MAEAAVIGREDADWGAVPVAFVKLRPGRVVTEDELARHCRELLAGYKVPREVRFVDELPRTRPESLSAPRCARS